MNVIQFGYGAMGAMLFPVLKGNPNVSKLTIFDPALKENHKENVISFVNKISNEELKQYHCAFVITPATTHYKILSSLIENGVKKIFVEKPAVTNDDEFKIILRQKGDCQIVTGFILRQSEPMFALKHILYRMEKESYRPEFASVVYQKNLRNNSSRTEHDLGVYEEIVHIWDLLFNYLKFGRADMEQINVRHEFDECNADRIVFSRISYLLRFDKYETSVNINASFRASERKREFYFSYLNDDGNRRHISLFFDTPEKIDRLVVTDNIGSTLYSEEYPSLKKLQHQVQETFTYFNTSKLGELTTFEENDTIIKLFDLVHLQLNNKTD